MENGHKIATNTIAQIISRLFNAVLSVVIIKIITHYLKTTGYGEYTLVYELVGFFGLACDLGLFTLAVDEMSKNKDKMQRILGNMLGLRLLLISIIGIFTCILAFLIPTFNQVMVISVIIAIVGMSANLIASTGSATLQVHLRMPTYATAVIIGKIISVIYIALSAWYNWGFIHLILAGTLNNLYVCGVTLYSANKLLPIRLYFERTEIIRILKKSAVYGTALILGSIYLRINTLMLGELRNQEIVGIFGVALRSYELLLLIPFSFMNSVLPSLSQHINTDRFAQLLQKSWDVLIMTGLGMGVGCFIMAEEMIKLISTGDDFSPAAILVRILVIASAFNFLSSLFQYILVSINKVKLFWYITLIEAVAAITFARIFIPQDGFVGQARAAAFAIVLAQMIHFVGLMWAAKSVRKITLSFKATLATLFSGLICGGYLFLIKPYIMHYSPLISLPIAFGTGGILYIYLLTKTGGLSSDLHRLVFEKIFKKWKLKA
jgi:O-antigen/teichoic acid export membrane protein